MKRLILDTTTRALVGVLAGTITTNQPEFVVSYVDKSTTALTEASTPGAFNNTTAVTLVAAPASGHRRTVAAINIFNKDTVAVTVTISYDDNGTLRTIWKGTLQAGEVKTADGVFDSNGYLKTAIPTMPASGLTGQVATANGGTGQDWGASSGIPKLSSGTASLVTAPSGDLVGHNDSQTLSNKTMSGTIPFTGLADFNTGGMRLPVGTGALTATQGHLQWQSTNKELLLHDGVRERSVMPVGFQAYALQQGIALTQGFAASSNIAAVSGTYLIPILLHASMLLYSVSVVNKDASLQRTWGWDLYVDRLGNNNTIDRVASSNGNDTFTAAANSVRSIVATSAHVYLPPGMYWLAIQNRHATNTFALGGDTVALPSMALNNTKFKTTGGTNGSTLDIVTSWSVTTSVYGVRLNGGGAAASTIILV